jgi:hypothetical protein
MAAKLNASSNTVLNARCHGLLSGDGFFEVRPILFSSPLAGHCA